MTIKRRLAELRARPNRLRRAYSRCLLLEAHWLGLGWLRISVLQLIDLLVLECCMLLLVLLLMLLLLLMLVLVGCYRLLRLLLVVMLLLLLLLVVVELLLLLLAYAGLLELHRMSLVHLLNDLLWLGWLWAPSISRDLLGGRVVTGRGWLCKILVLLCHRSRYLLCIGTGHAIVRALLKTIAI